MNIKKLSSTELRILKADIEEELESRYLGDFTGLLSLRASIDYLVSGKKPKYEDLKAQYEKKLEYLKKFYGKI